MFKRVLYALGFVALVSFSQCSGDGSVNPNCGSHNGKQLYLGPKGGCYYINSNGNKEYVNRSECNC